VAVAVQESQAVTLLNKESGAAHECSHVVGRHSFTHTTHTHRGYYTTTWAGRQLRCRALHQKSQSHARSLGGCPRDSNTCHLVHTCRAPRKRVHGTYHTRTSQTENIARFSVTSIQPMVLSAHRHTALIKEVNAHTEATPSTHTPAPSPIHPQSHNTHTAQCHL